MASPQRDALTTGVSWEAIAIFVEAYFAVRSMWKNKAPALESQGPVLKATRTVALSPEIKEGLHHHRPTSQYLLLFLFGFLLGLLLSCHKHLLLGFHGWALT
jgi:hypothetical protein